MSSAASPWNAGEAREAAQRAASHAAVPSRRYAASSLTTPSHLRFEKVVRERGRRRVGWSGFGRMKNRKARQWREEELVAMVGPGGVGRIEVVEAVMRGGVSVGEGSKGG